MNNYDYQTSGKKSTNMKNYQIFQVGIVVKDIKEAIERFSHFGLGPYDDPTLSLPPPTGGISFRDKPLKGEVKILSTHQGDLELEIFEPIEGKSPWKEFLDTKGEGIHHIAFFVDDIDAEISKLSQQEVEVLLRAKTEDGGGGAYLD